jgi:hypothetical protein
MKEIIPVTVYIAQGQLQANVIKARLECEGIPVILQYESLGIVFGMTVDGLGEVKVMVPEPLEARARAILSEADEAGEEAEAGEDGEEDEAGEEADANADDEADETSSRSTYTDAKAKQAA